MGELIDKAKGKVKRVVGAATCNQRLEAEGAADQIKGKAKGIVEEVKVKAKEAGRAVKRAVKKNPDVE